MWWAVNILPKFEVPSSYGLAVMIFEDWEEEGHGLTYLINKLINDKGVSRTAPATPGLLITVDVSRCYNLTETFDTIII